MPTSKTASQRGGASRAAKKLSKLVVRNVKFGLTPKLPRYWNGGRKSVTIFYNNLSLFFPEGERFFIRSVKNHIAKVTSEKTKAEARDFYVQEAYHTREHELYNAILAAQGYPVEEIDARIKFILGNVKARLPQRWNLAATCALEHFTALLATFLLTTPELLADAPPEMQALWRWHAAEENEHKAVAYDVYQEAGGNYPERAVIMFFTTVIFAGIIAAHQAQMMKTDGIAADPREWLALARHLFLGEPGRMFALTGEYLDYYRPGFHPWDHDHSDLLTAFKKDFARNKAYRAA
jgi:predicted metal-dependent hydrolase